jgi:hypothetical protein
VSIGNAYKHLGKQIIKSEYKVMEGQGMGVYNKRTVKEIISFKKWVEKMDKGD